MKEAMGILFFVLLVVLSAAHVEREIDPGEAPF